MRVTCVFLMALVLAISVQAEELGRVALVQALKDAACGVKLMCVAAHPDDEDGASLAFTFEGGTDLAAGGFPPDHLREHMASATGVAVAYHTEGDARVAVRLSDAPWIGQ